MKTPFLGTAYRSRSKDLSDQLLINMYPEFVEDKLGKGKEVGAFLGSPGLDLLATLGPGPVRGVHAFIAEGSSVEQLYVVSGFGVYLVQANLSFSLIGNLNNLSNPPAIVSIVDNGQQVAIFDGPFGYSIVSGVLAEISLPFMNNPGVATYQDGFVILTETLTFNLWQSNLNDLTTWDSLNFTTEDGQPDNVVSVLDLHRQVVVFKENHIAFYVNAGTSGFAFQRLEGVYPNVGCAAVLSPAELGDAVAWLGQNEEGGNSFYVMGGYEPVRMSTFPIEARIATYPTVTDCIGYSYSQNGHLFYVATFPSGNETWALDITASRQAGFPVWHQEAYLANGLLSRGLAQCATNFAGRRVVGDYTSGNIYALDVNTNTHNGQPIKRLRTWRAMAEPMVKSARNSALEIDMETGIGVTTPNPLVVLRYSDDGGYTWSAERFQTAGPVGQTGWRVRFNRLGMVRRGLASDRIYELSSTDQFRIAWIGADLS